MPTASVVLKSSPDGQISFQLSGDDPPLSGAGRPVWGPSLWRRRPPSFCRELGSPPDSFLFSRNRWEAWNQRRKLGEGCAWRCLWLRCAGGRVSQVPSLPLGLLPGSPSPAAQALTLPRCPVGRKGV